MIMENIAILCSGGDVSGMNAALKRFVEYSKMRGLNPYFVDKYKGLELNNQAQLFKKHLYNNLFDFFIVSFKCNISPVSPGRHFLTG